MTLFEMVHTLAFMEKWIDLLLKFNLGNISVWHPPVAPISVPREGTSGNGVTLLPALSPCKVGHPNARMCHLSLMINEFSLMEIRVEFSLMINDFSLMINDFSLMINDFSLKKNQRIFL